MTETFNATDSWYDSLNDVNEYNLLKLFYIYLDAIQDTDTEPYDV